jgi:hypothetical protein
VTRSRAALVLALAAVWTVAAWLLWRSSLPAYHLPRLDEHALFPAHELRRAQHYSGVERLFWLGKTVTQLVVLGVFARYGVRWMRESAAGPIGTGMLLGMIGFALVWSAELPFSGLNIWWRHHNGLSGSYVTATIGDWFALGAQFILLCVALAIVMALARRVGQWWWLPAAPVFVGLRTLLAFIAPWLLGGSSFHAPYVAKLQATEHVHVPVRVLSGFSEPNAFATASARADASSSGSRSPSSRSRHAWTGSCSRTSSGTSRTTTSGSRSAGMRSSRSRSQSCSPAQPVGAAGWECPWPFR